MHDCSDMHGVVATIQALVTEGEREWTMRRTSFGGKHNPVAGLTLPREVRQAGDSTPIVFYSSRRSLAPSAGRARCCRQGQVHKLAKRADAVDRRRRFRWLTTERKPRSVRPLAAVA